MIERNALIVTGVIASVLNLLVVLCFVHNILQESRVKQVKTLTYRFNRICGIWSLIYVLLSIDPTTILGVCENCTEILWIGSAIMIAVTLSTLLIIWIDSMVRIFQNNRHADDSFLRKLTIMQVAYIVSLAVLLLTRYGLSLSHDLKTELTFRVIVSLYIGLSVIFVSIAVSKMVLTTIRKMNETSEALKSKSPQGEGSSGNKEVKRIARKLIGFIIAVSLGIPAVIYQASSDAALLKKAQQGNQIAGESAYRAQPLIYISSCYSSALFNFAIYMLSIRIKNRQETNVQRKSITGDVDGQGPSVKSLTARTSSANSPGDTAHATLEPIAVRAINSP